MKDNAGHIVNMVLDTKIRICNMPALFLIIEMRLYFRVGEGKRILYFDFCEKYVKFNFFLLFFEWTGI